MPTDLIGYEFLEDFLDDLRHLEEGFAEGSAQGLAAHTVTGFKFTRPQVSTLINAIDMLLAFKRQSDQI
jgi:hypothetical protein